MKKQFQLITLVLSFAAFNGLSAAYMGDDNDKEVKKWNEWRKHRKEFLEHHNITVPESLLDAEEKAEMKKIKANESIPSDMTEVRTKLEKLKKEIDETPEMTTTTEEEKMSETMY